MSDTPQATPAKTAAPDGAAPAGPAAPVMIGIIVVALALGVALGTLVLGPKLARSKGAAADPAATKSEAGHGSKGGHGKEGKDGKEDKATIYRIENLIVNPSGSEGSHFLMATVAIELDDAKREESLRGHEDEIRDHVITVLERQTLESLSASGARDTLRGRIATALTPLIGPTDPARIYLPQFVIQ